MKHTSSGPLPRVLPHASSSSSSSSSLSRATVPRVESTPLAPSSSSSSLKPVKSPKHSSSCSPGVRGSPGSIGPTSAGVEEPHPRTQVFEPGDALDVKDSRGIWCLAEVLQANAQKVLIHYCGWPSTFDETIEVVSERLAPPLTRTRGVHGLTGRLADDHRRRYTQSLKYHDKCVVWDDVNAQWIHARFHSLRLDQKLTLDNGIVVDPQFVVPPPLASSRLIDDSVCASSSESLMKKTTTKTFTKMTSSRELPTLHQDECSVCMEPFTSLRVKNHPRLLSCLHCFCLGCLHSLQGRRTPDYLVCPICATAHKGLDVWSLPILTRFVFPKRSKTTKTPATMTTHHYQPTSTTTTSTTTTTATTTMQRPPSSSSVSTSMSSLSSSSSSSSGLPSSLSSEETFVIMKPSSSSSGPASGTTTTSSSSSSDNDKLGPLLPSGGGGGPGSGGMCRLHPGQRVICYCLSHHVLVCWRCSHPLMVHEDEALESQRHPHGTPGHHVISLKELYERQVASVRKSREEVSALSMLIKSQKAQQEIQTASITAAIDGYFDILKMKLEDRRLLLHRQYRELDKPCQETLKHSSQSTATLLADIDKVFETLSMGGGSGGGCHSLGSSSSSSSSSATLSNSTSHSHNEKLVGVGRSSTTTTAATTAGGLTPLVAEEDQTHKSFAFLDVKHLQEWTAKVSQFAHAISASFPISKPIAFLTPTSSQTEALLNAIVVEPSKRSS